MTTSKTFFFLSAFLILQLSCFAQKSADEGALAAAREYVKTVNKFAEKEGDPHLIVADVSDYNEGSKPVWKKFASQMELENSREEVEVYTIAFVWFREKKPAAVNFTYSSPSGDWAQYVEYVFRPDGTAAGVRRELRTFMGDLIVVRTAFFDQQGKTLSETKEFFDLETKKPVPATDNFADVDVEIYKQVKDLPFAAELAVSSERQAVSGEQ